MTSSKQSVEQKFDDYWENEFLATWDGEYPIKDWTLRELAQNAFNAGIRSVIFEKD